VLKVKRDSFYSENNDFLFINNLKLFEQRLETLFGNFKLFMSIASECKKLFESALFKHFRPPSLMIFNE